ncbi:MAG TPA: aldo/keto reductase [Propionibacteriaceae bacterium]
MGTHQGANESAYGPICLGTDSFGSRTPPDTAWALIDQYVEAGGTLVDTANAYACWAPGCVGGESERVIGDWISRRSDGASIQVATKVGFGFGVTPAGLRSSDLRRECEGSLRRLRVETIDLYLAHCDDESLPAEEILDAFDGLQSAGHIRAYGISNWSEPRLAAAARAGRRVAALEYRSSYLRPASTADFGGQVVSSSEIEARGRELGAILLAYSVLLNGSYTRPDRALPDGYAGSENERRLRLLDEIAHEASATRNQVVLAWTMHRNPPVVPIIAATTAEHLAENLAARDVRLTPAQLSRLTTAHQTTYPEGAHENGR